MSIHPPLIINAGRISKKQLKRLRRGEGKHLAEVEGYVQKVCQKMGEEAAGKEFVPVVVVYRRKRSGKKKGFKRLKSGLLWPIM